MSTKSTKVADTRIDAPTLAVLMTDAVGTHDLALGRTWPVSVGAKRVRSIARDTIDRFVNRTGYTAHAYTMAEAAQIVDVARNASRGHGTVDVNAARAALGATKTAKAPRKRSKVTKGESAAQSGAESATDGAA